MKNVPVLNEASSMFKVESRISVFLITIPSRQVANRRKLKSGNSRRDWPFCLILPWARGCVIEYFGSIEN